MCYRTCVGDIGFTGKTVNAERDISVVHEYVRFLPQEPGNVEGEDVIRLVRCINEYLIFILSYLISAERSFLADRTIGRAFGTLCRLSVCLSSVVCDVLYPGETVHPGVKVSITAYRKSYT